MDRDSSHNKGVVLKFKKRRFDGGSEVALIRAFERQEARLQPRMLVRTELLSVIPGNAAGFAQNRPLYADTSLQPPPAPLRQEAVLFAKNPVLEALCLGPLELCVGLLGVMTATLGIVTFRHMKNDSLSRQSLDVLKDCLRTIGKGFVDTVSGPGKAMRLVLDRP